MVTQQAGVRRNLWARQQSGLYAPKRMNFPINGLVLYLPFWHPELSGSPIVSKDLNAHSCTVYGALWSPRGRWFDNLDDKIDCGNPATLALTGSQTQEVWMNYDVATDTGSLISKDNNVGQRQIIFKINATPVIQFLVFKTDAVFSSIVGSTTLLIDTWYHIVAVYTSVADGSSLLDLYLNGSPDAVQVTNAISPVQTQGVNYLIGHREYAGGGEPFGGTIGEARIYSRALSAAEILHNYNATKWRYQ